MVDVVVVRLNSSNLVYYLSPNCMEFAKNDLVVIDSENGMQLGTVVKANYKEQEEKPEAEVMITSSRNHAPASFFLVTLNVLFILILKINL